LSPPRVRTRIIGGVTRAHSEAPPTWYRLSEESWAEIREAYRGGATARELGARWRVSPTSIYRHACVGGWTKKASADALARAHAGEISAEEAADAAGLTPAPAEPVEATPSAMRERAMRDLGRALAAGRYQEAQTLAKLVEQLGRLAEAEPAAPAQAQAPPFEPGSMDGIYYLVERISEGKAEAAWPRIERIAQGLLDERVAVPMIFMRAALRWRAEMFGPEVAEADRAAHQSCPHYSRFYDEAGRVRDGWGVYTDGKEIPSGVSPQFDDDFTTARALALGEGAGDQRAKRRRHPEGRGMAALSSLGW
jgi:hypothetical protein